MLCVNGVDMVINPLKGKNPYGWHFEQNVYDVNGETRSLKASQGSGNILKIILGGNMNNLRIRKLTPKECWRLMGFDDSDFEKAVKVNSNTQLYKQAGNSIVVNVLERILENLIDKDERIKILELFGGIGACSKALERLGIEYEIADYVEIDKYAVKSFNAIHNTDFKSQDICEWNKDIDVDLIMHGSPCQDFSLAGKQAGGDEGSGTRSSLMYETIRIVEKLKPKYVIWENVKNVISKKHKHNFDNYIERMSELGYVSYYQVLNAKDYGIPQNRERVFTVSIRDDTYFSPNSDDVVDDESIYFEFPQKQELKLKLKDMLEDNVDEKYYLSDKMINYISATGTANFKNPDSKINLDIARPLTTDPNKRAGTTNYWCNDLPNNYNLEPINAMPDGTCRTIKNQYYKTSKANFERNSTYGATGVLLIKNATKQGYLEAFEGDGVDISSRMQYHRGNVQKQSCQTITTSGGNERGVVVYEDKLDKYDLD